MERCLKPGGLLVIVDGDKDMYDAQRHKIPMAKLEGDEDVSSVSSEGSWFERKMWGEDDLYSAPYIALTLLFRGTRSRYISRI